MFKRLLPALFAASFTLYSCVSAPPPAAPSPAAQAAAPAAAQAAPAKSDARNRAQELITGDKPQGAPAQGVAPAAGAPAETATDGSSATAPAEAAAASGLTPKEQQFFDTYLKRLKYMMVVKDGAAVNDFQKRTILTKGNEVLLRQGFDVVQYDQLLKNMADQKSAYEAEAGETMSLTQYIAQKLGADVYVELDCQPHSSTENGRYYGDANFTANMFDPSTAELLGSVTFRTDRSVSTSSEGDALVNALTAGTAQLMPRIIRDSTNVLRNRYANGIRYQLVIQKTPDARTVSLFRRNLRSRVRDVVMGPSAADQTTMDVYLFGSISDLEDSCYTAFERTPGMENAYTVYSRGKSITFNSGN